MNIFDHPAPSSSRHDCAPFAGSIHGAGKPFTGTTFRHSWRHICRNACPSGQPIGFFHPLAASSFECPSDQPL